MNISIHASREGSDFADPRHAAQDSDFNPRFPRGKRLFKAFRVFPLVRFQSTLPAREATNGHLRAKGKIAISIHASREGSDQGRSGKRRADTDFNPRFPRGKRLIVTYRKKNIPLFQSTLPAREAT